MFQASGNTMPTALLYLLGILIAAPAISTDMYLPAMPSISEALNTSPAQIQMTLSIFFLGYGFGQLIYGPLCDSFGRRTVLLFGLVFYIIGCILCAVSVNIEQLIVARLLQALGGCAAVVIPRAIISDHTQGNHTAKALSTAMGVMIIGPLIAPTLGGLILLLTSWQGIFWALTIYGISCTLITSLWVKESLPPSKRQPFHISNVIAGYQQVFSNKHIVLLLCCEVFASVTLLTFVTGSAFVFINIFGLSPQQYGLLFSAVAAGLFIGSVINGKLVTRLGSVVTLQLGLALSLCGAALMIASLTLIPNNFFFFVSSLWFCLAPSILIRANATALGFGYLPGRNGTVSAVFGAASMGLGGVSASLINALNNDSPIPMVAIMIAGYVGSTICYVGWKWCSSSSKQPG